MGKGAERDAAVVTAAPLSLTLKAVGRYWGFNLKESMSFYWERVLGWRRFGGEEV
jgi:hypothetical protein